MPGRIPKKTQSAYRAKPKAKAAKPKVKLASPSKSKPKVRLKRNYQMAEYDTSL